MKESEPEDQGNALAAVTRGIRLDLVIAVCALLVSSLATVASLWQARVMQAQTAVLEQQLGAQVWPYVGVDESLNDDTAQISFANDGLGPAVMRSAVATVDGKPESNFIAVLHAVMGLRSFARKPRRENAHAILNVTPPGSVLRAGESTVEFAITSKRFARPLMRASGRIDIRICYCAIVANKCWLYDTASTHDPKPVGECPEIKDDLLHASPADLSKLSE